MSFWYWQDKAYLFTSFIITQKNYYNIMYMYSTFARNTTYYLQGDLSLKNVLKNLLQIHIQVFNYTGGCLLL